MPCSSRCVKRPRLDVKRADFKLDMLGTHLFMNFRIIDEHGRQLAQGRNIAALKAQWGSQGAGRFPGAWLH